MLFDFSHLSVSLFLFFSNSVLAKMTEMKMQKKKMLCILELKLLVCGFEIGIIMIYVLCV